jgi:hypothetical protein
MSADRVSAALLLVFAAFVIVEARALPYWTASAPGPGFVPFWLGVLLALASVAMFVRTFGRAKALPHRSEADLSSAASAKEEVRTDFESGLPDRATTFRVAIVVGLTAAAAALSLVLGLVLTSGMFMGATLAYLRPRHGLANSAAALLTPIVVWLLFVRWLAVPLPAGPFGF